ncbi:unnamed protein product [Pseudo-nitzschia multistriata]|uniref:LNS2/PITP domain-containing protein n=1 Tax=Pseudo-nitzschia multistriata TaxID=183589 RepID=A0A448YV24_9STRA|nr:unnamed protein product [Pseudo-nitzschia multistriata]
MNRRRSTNKRATKLAAAVYIVAASVIGFALNYAMAIDNYVDDDEYALMGEQHSWSSNILGNLCCLQAFNFDGGGEVLEGSAFDVIVVEGEDGKFHQNSDFLVSFKGANEADGNNTHNIVMEVNHHAGTKAWFPIIRQHSKPNDNNEPDTDEDKESNTFDEERFWGCCHPSAGNIQPGMLSKFKDGAVESNDDPSSTLKAFLKPGRNPIRYLLLDDQQVVGIAHAHIYLWKHDDSVVISDIDGTITKSNARGVLGTIITQRYDKVCHAGICQILSKLSLSSQVVYLTSRPIGLANQTRKFLSTLKQGNETLPIGPLLGFGGKLPQLLIMEIVTKSTQKFKAKKLWDNVVQPFRKATNNDPKSPSFVAGFGNNFMDMQSYHAIGLDLDRIFKINKKSQIVTFDKENITSQNSNGDFSFPPHQWYKDRIGTKFDGYTDSELVDRICPELT